MFFTSWPAGLLVLWCPPRKQCMDVILILFFDLFRGSFILFLITCKRNAESKKKKKKEKRTQRSGIKMAAYSEKEGFDRSLNRGGGERGASL